MQKKQSKHNSDQKFHAKQGLATPLNNPGYQAKAPQLSEVLLIKYEYLQGCRLPLGYFIFTIFSLSWIFSFIYYALIAQIEQGNYGTAAILFFTCFLPFYVMLKIVLQYVMFAEPLLFRFLHGAQRKQQLFKLLNIIQRNNSCIQLSQRRIRVDGEDQRQSFSNCESMNLYLIDSYIENNDKLGDLFQRSKVVFIEFQVQHVSENPQDSIRVNDFLQNYKKDFEASNDKQASLQTKHNLGIDDSRIPSYFYTSYGGIKAIKFFAWFFTIIGLLISFLMLIRCLVKKKKIRIVKKIRVQ